jgi:hypothetical protein
MNATSKDLLPKINDELKFIFRIKHLLPVKDIDKIDKMLADLHSTIQIVSQNSVELLGKKCKECGETHPKYFPKSVKTLCTQCTCKTKYIDTIKPAIEVGKERNVKAKLAREKCKDCNLVITNENSIMFEWDHVNPCNKTFAISKMNMRKDELYYEEIKKCDLVCSNCHSIRTKAHFENNMIRKKLNMKEMQKKTTS